MYKLIPFCKKIIPEIFHNTDNLKRGVLRRVIAQSIKIPGHPENIEQQQAVELSSFQGAKVFDVIMDMEKPNIDSYPSVQHILSSEVALRSSYHLGCTSALSPGTPPFG